MRQSTPPSPGAHGARAARGAARLREPGVERFVQMSRLQVPADLPRAPRSE